MSWSNLLLCLINAFVMIVSCLLSAIMVGFIVFVLHKSTGLDMAIFEWLTPIIICLGLYIGVHAMESIMARLESSKVSRQPKRRSKTRWL